jgi:hypothetical protein
MPFTCQVDSADNLLVTEVNGALTMDEVRAWRRQLDLLTSRMDQASSFAALVDLSGYEAFDQERQVHQAMREVMPHYLARHGFVVGFWGLYAASPPFQEAGPACRAVAHVHHDRDKMDRYNELLRTSTEQFFRDRSAAATWLASVRGCPARLGGVP